ncbi:MAG TPA: UDP-N-acetylmuramoyl-L-alanyl-D-glutamate--2,6-diaminopimelate ligase [Phycisphaerae bacterium]|nr:UDP-N-acetylmuramoyl-L-alanyl-D-glutamate--2,6-diaminopimelate ligase [Phycisphaerae bacterium]
MRFSELIQRIGGRVQVMDVRAGGAGGGGDPEILRVCEDSRKVRAGDLFVARGGTKTSGEQFVADAIAKGAVAIVSEESPGIAIPGLEREGAFARVGNANLALALLAHELAGNPTSGMKMIGVTGTKGKTTVAYLMRSVLKAAGKKVGMVGTVEIDDGVTVVPAEMTTPGVVELVELFSRMKANGVTHCVMEVSSHSLHQHRVAGIDWAVAIFTNLTGDHLDYHKTMEEYAAAKAMLFQGLKGGAVAVINADDSYATQMVRDCTVKVLRYALNGAADWTAAIPTMSASGMDMEIKGRDGISQYFASPLVGRHNAYNTLCALAGADALGIPLDKIIDGLDEMEGVPGRLQPVVPEGWGRQGMRFQVLVDYAHTHDSLENVLRAVRTTMGKGRLICVFGCGGDRDRTKRPKMAAVAETFADLVIVTSDNPRTEDPHAIIAEIRTGFSSNANGKVKVEPDRRAAIRTAISIADSGDVVLLAGKGHENYQIIGTTKHHFDDVEEAQAALKLREEK